MPRQNSEVVVTQHAALCTIAESVLDSLEEQGITEERIRQKVGNFVAAPKAWKLVHKWAPAEKQRWIQRGHTQNVYVRECLKGWSPSSYRVVERILSQLKKWRGGEPTHVELGVFFFVERGVQRAHVFHFVENVETTLAHNARRK